MPQTTTRTQAQVTTITNTTAAVLAIQPTMSNKLLLLAALHEAENRNVRAEVHAFELQASNILNEAYTEGLRKALEAKEEKGYQACWKEGRDRRVTYDAAVEEWAIADNEQKNEQDAIKANNTQIKAVGRFIK